MPDVSRLDVAGVDVGESMLPGDLVRELVTTHEEEIEALLARADKLEALADEAERAVREHPAFALLDPDQAARLVPEPPAPVEVDDGRPRTTVVKRSTAMPPSGTRTESTVAPPVRASVAGPDDAPKGLLERITTSHWWWRVGIVLVAVALLLVKFG